MEIRISEDLNSLNKSFTNYFTALLNERQRLSVALSGGSTPKSLFNYWSENHKTDIEWERVDFFWGDERCVPPTDEQSNYRMTKENLFDNVAIPAKNIFRIEGENNPQTEAQRYSSVLNTQVEQNNHLPALDLLMLGMGEDGHTASIFPYEIDLWNSKSNCVVATHPDSGQKRVSLSGTVINNARNVAFLVTGASKAEKVKAIIESQQKVIDLYPAARVNPTSGSLVWFLDREAARLLSKECK